MRKYIIILLLGCVLVSCGWEETEEAPTAAGATRHTSDHFSMLVPASWTTLDPSVELATPATGTVELAMRSAEMMNGYFNNLSVLSETLQKATRSADYARTSMILSAKQYPEFVKLRSQKVEFADGIESLISVFEAKYNLTTPKRLFVQTGRVCDTQAYIITISVDTSVEDPAKYISLIKTFSCNTSQEE